MEKKEKKIGLVSIIILLFISLCIDGVEALLGLTGIGIIIVYFTTGAKWVFFWLVLYFGYGILLTKGQLRKFTLGLTAVAGVIPFVNALPEFTVGLFILLMSNYLGVDDIPDAVNLVSGRKKRKDEESSREQGGNTNSNENITRASRGRKSPLPLPSSASRTTPPRIPKMPPPIPKR